MSWTKSSDAVQEAAELSALYPGQKHTANVPAPALTGGPRLCVAEDSLPASDVITETFWPKEPA